MRSFVAIPMPEAVAAALAPVQTALPFDRLVEAENLHLTLAFLGDQPDRMLEEVHFALETIRHPGFDLTLSGLDTFGTESPQVLNIGIQPAPGLTELQQRIKSRLHGVGLQIEKRRWHPHVTLARFPKLMSRDEIGRLGRFLAGRADHRLPPFRVTEFCLFESILTSDGAHYEVLASYPLSSSGTTSTA